MERGLRISRRRLPLERSAFGARSPAGADSLSLTKRHSHLVDAKLVFVPAVFAILRNVRVRRPRVADPYRTPLLAPANQEATRPPCHYERIARSCQRLGS